jgi:hypothetical protein
MAKSKGLGDTIAKITEVTGIKKVVDTISDITGVPCNCSRRQETLNNWVPYNNTETPINELVEQNIDDFCEGIYIINNNLVFYQDGEMYNYVMGQKIYIESNLPYFENFKQYYKLGIISKYDGPL